MRDDMSKVLVESPRVGRRYARAIVGIRRRRRNEVERDGETARTRIGMRRDGTNKYFGEHLQPLFRYLQKQVHRPWSKVYSELCTHLDRRNVVQAHAFVHIRNHVAVDTVWIDGQVCIRDWNGLAPVVESGTALFVHPLTGILLPNRAMVGKRRGRQDKAAKESKRNAERRIGLPGMPVDRQWHRVKGIWYEASLCLLDQSADAAPVYDVVLGHLVNRECRKQLAATYGYNDVYAWAKRQLPARTLRKHGLTSQAD